MSTLFANTPVQPADITTASEFTFAINNLVSPSTASSLLSGLKDRSRRLSDAYGSRVSSGEDEFVGSILEWSSISRRARQELLTHFEIPHFAASLEMIGKVELDPLHRLDEAFPRAGGVVPEFQKISEDLAWEVMHFLDPVNVPLYTRWVFNRETETGALALLTADEYDLFGIDDVEGYSRVAFSLEYLKSALFAAGLSPFGDGPYSMDCYLAMVYGVYMSTVLEMRMTKEFIKILPPLVDVAKRLLGMKGVTQCQ